MDLKAPSAKRRKVSADHCIICFKTLNHKKEPVVKNPTSEGLNAILKTSELKKDDVYETLWPLQHDILNFTLKVAFHKSCRAKYTSKSNLDKFHSRSGDQQPSSSTIPSRLSRSETGGFDIRNECFICGKPNTIRDKLSSVSTGTGHTTREKVLQAAKDRQDSHIRMRMLSYPDLFAYDAKYHRVCYSHYISELNIASARRKSGEAAETSVYDEAFDELKTQLNQTVFSKQKTVTTLVRLTDQFVKLLLELGASNAQQYRAWKLKERLRKHYGDQLVIVSFDGSTDIICSSAVTLGDALTKASALHDTDEETEYKDIGDAVPPTPLDETQILHTAAGILSKHMDGITCSTDMYAPVADTNIQKCAEFVPDPMYDFVQWCLNDKAYNNLASCSSEDVPKNNLKTIAICHNMISLNQSVFTAITLDLALHIHHEFGSRRLIDLLNSMGHCASYDEVRRFLTSVAVDEANNTDNVYIPKRLQHLRSVEYSPVIDAAIDNFDQNEATLDGKSTTHAMAAVLFHRDVTQCDDQSIPRLLMKSLSASDTAYSGFDDLQR